MDIGICKPDSLCKHIKNPVSYARIKAKSLTENKKKTKNNSSKKPINKENNQTKTKNKNN
jgi:hypothetical protein